MTEITVFLKDGKPIGFDAHGHTGYAECGEDIVCAAVSAITQTAAIKIAAGRAYTWNDAFGTSFR